MHYKFTLPELPYAYDALEPYIDAATMQLHYEKHHQGYINNLNKALEPYPHLQTIALRDMLSNLTIVPESIRTTVQNNGGGHENHSFFWHLMKAHGGGEPHGSIGKAIQQKFGGFSDFQEQLNHSAQTRFGSGWAWLILNKAGDLEVISTPNQDSPLLNGTEPLLGVDVWEHAYYLKYQNKRIDYVQAWWHTINWSYVDELYRTHCS